MLTLLRARALRYTLAIVAIGSLGTAAVAFAHDNQGQQGNAWAYGHYYRTTGWVTSFSGSTLTVEKFNGHQQSYVVSGTTTYKYADRSSATSTNVKKGEVVTVNGTRPTTSGAKPNAKQVIIALAQVGGMLTSNSGTTLTVTDAQGFTRTISDTGATCYKGRTTEACSSIPTGAIVAAVGKVDADGVTLDASKIRSFS